MNLQEVLRNFEKSENVVAGVCGADYFYEIKQELLEKNQRLETFVQQDIEKRLNPSLTLNGAKTIIALGMGYKKVYPSPNNNDIRGYISQGAVGLDYHLALKGKLQALADEISKEHNFQYEIFVDVGPLNDRAVALRCGLGVKGKHQGVINKKFGSQMFIGYMITDIDMEHKKTTVEVCCGCDICLQKCPTGALSHSGFDVDRCISYLTQKKGVLTKEQMQHIGKNLYGCDVCQDVCPMNKGAEGEIINNVDQPMPNLKEILELSNKEFKNRFSQTAMGWRGKKVIQRNAICGLYNIGTQESMGIIKPFLNSEDEVLKQQANLAFKDN